MKWHINCWMRDISRRCWFEKWMVSSLTSTYEPQSTGHDVITVHGFHCEVANERNYKVVRALCPTTLPINDNSNCEEEEIQKSGNQTNVEAVTQTVEG